MKSKFLNKIAVTSLTVALTFSVIPQAFADGTNTTTTVTVTNVSTAQVDQAITKLVSFYQGQGIVKNVDVGFGLNALGEDLNISPYSTNQDQFINYIAANPTSTGSWVKSILAILSAGKDPKNFNGKNYVDGLLKSSQMDTYSASYGLIALTTLGAATSSDTALTSKRDAFITSILTTNRLGDGWADYLGTSLDIDTTAMALIALAPYKDQANVASVITPAVDLLSQHQENDGGFLSPWSGNNSASLAVVIQAITALGVDPQGAKFTKGAGNAVSKLLSFQMEDGTFRSQSTDTAADTDFATPQSFQALAALKQFNQKGSSDLFRTIVYHSSVDQQSSPSFTITNTNMDRSNGITATVTITPTNVIHNGNEVVVFELMDGQTPKGITAIQKDITSPETVSAYFNQVSSTATVKVFVVDTLPNNSAVMGNSLALPCTLQ
jgi:hypothetical protein